jgi:hypothetical protein
MKLNNLKKSNSFNDQKNQIIAQYWSTPCATLFQYNLWLQALGMHIYNFEKNQDGYKFAKLHCNQIQYNNKKAWENKRNIHSNVIKNHNNKK